MFENVLLESATRSGQGRRAMTLPVSIAAHALVLGVFLGSSLWSVQDVPDPPIPVIFHTPAALASPPAGTSNANGQEHRIRRSIAPTLPAPIPETPRLITENREMVSSENAKGHQEGPAGDDAQAGPGSIPGGTGDPSSRGTLAGAGSDATFTVGGEVKAPQLIERIDPPYPEIARKPRLEGVVVLEAVITAAGSVEGATVVKSAHPILDDAARRALLQWRYRPATLNGRPVRVYLTVTVSFILH